MGGQVARPAGACVRVRADGDRVGIWLTAVGRHHIRSNSPSFRIAGQSIQFFNEMPIIEATRMSSPATVFSLMLRTHLFIGSISALQAPPAVSGEQLPSAQQMEHEVRNLIPFQHKPF